MLKKRFGLLPPDYAADAVEDRLRAEDGDLVEAAAEVAGRGRVGDAAGAEDIQVGDVRAEQFQVFQTPAPGQQVVGNVEHMVAVVVGEVEFQQAEMAVDRLGESELADQQVHGPDAAGGHGPPIGDFIMDVRRRHDGPVTATVNILVQAAGYLPLALCDLFAYLGIHSKTSVRWVVVLLTPIQPQKTPKVFGFLCLTHQRHHAGLAWLGPSAPEIRLTCGPATLLRPLAGRGLVVSWPHSTACQRSEFGSIGITEPRRGDLSL